MTRCSALMLLLVLPLSLPLTGCKGRGQAATKDKKSAPIPVQIAELAPSSIARVLEYDADVKGLLEVKILSQVPERIISLKVKEGDRVRKGQVLAVLRADSLSAGVSSASAAVDAARVERDNLRSELARQEKLLQRKIVSAALVEQLRARLLAAEAQIRRFEAVTKQASTARGNAVIRAPISGIIGQRFLEQGDLAIPSVPICTVVQMDRVELILEVPEKDLALIRKGMVAQLFVARYPKQPFSGEVVRILPTIDRMTRTAQVKVELPNKDHRLMPGMLARVKLEVERHDDAVVVPYSSLIIEMGTQGKVTYRVFVLKGGRSTGLTVTLGIVADKRVEIKSGLKFGDKLVTRGQHLLENGRSIKVVERLTADGEVVSVKVKAPDPKKR